MKSGDGNPPPRHKAATEAEIEAARRIHANPSSDAIEVDDDAKACRGADEGTWVQAWVWVPDEDIYATRKRPPRRSH